MGRRRERFGTGDASVGLACGGLVLLASMGCGREPLGSAGGAGGSTMSGGATASGGDAGGGAANAAGGGPFGTGGLSGGESSGGAATGGSGGTPPSGGSPGDASGGVGNGSGGVPSAGAVLIPDPSWTCGLPAGIVDPELGELVFEVTLDVGGVHEVGQTQYGERRVLDIAGGVVSGPDVSAEFLSGGLDFELALPTGSLEVEQVNVLRAEGGAIIYLRTCGVAAPGETTARIVPDFEAPNSSELAWLNTGEFVGTRTFDSINSELRLAVYDVSGVDQGGPEIQLADPTEVPHQPWECSTNSGAEGPAVFTETVTLGGSLSVGASKRGNRNIIPITGGTVSGQFEGEVVPGGADYQLIGGSTTLDARYVLQSYDGEFLVVRNCGPFGALIPWFEARADGPYAFLNEGAFLSSDPGSAGGGVSITFYEKQ